MRTAIGKSINAAINSNKIRNKCFVNSNKIVVLQYETETNTIFIYHKR